MQKLVEIGIPPHIVQWMAAFLLNRRHIVKIGNITSESGSPNGGVPQGTLSGPKSFLVHINDLTTPCPMYKYVDDSTIFEICDAETVSILQESAEVAKEWSNNNYMKINASKTHELLTDFSKDKVFSALPNITMSGVEIQRTKSAEILGVTISDYLSWNIQVDNIVSKAIKRVYMLYQLKRSGINQADLLSIHVSVIRPVLEYACPVWGTNIPGYLSDKIEMVQKRALNAIYPGMSYDSILERLNISLLASRRIHLCTKYFNDMKRTDHKLHHLLPEPRNVQYSLRKYNDFPTIRARTNRYKNSFIPWCLSNSQL